jgi:osmoprotectant transport system permease protein
MNAAWTEALALLPERLAQHVILSAAALGLGLAIALPLAVFAMRHPSVRWPVLTGAGLIQTIPGLALLALFYPLLLALSGLTSAWFGYSFQALGFLPALLALTLYSMLPILRNTVTGLMGVDRDVLEAADGVGMTANQKLFLVQLPFAAPIILAGIRTAAVWTIGTATLSTPVGQPSLGNYIFSGLQTENWVSVLVGCLGAAGLALIVDQMLGLVEDGLKERQRGQIWVGITAIAAGTLAAMATTLVPKPVSYVVGAKNFSEQFILAEMIGARLEKAGASVSQTDGLGSAIAFRALEAGDVDIYVDYSGTLWANVMGRTDVPSRAVMLAELTQWMAANRKVVVLGSLGFENAYALAMRRADAERLGIKTLDDLAAKGRDLRLGSDLEFLSRPEYAALKAAYGLRFKAETSYNPTFMYRAIASKEADVISAFSSDGRIAAQDLVVLADPKGAIPAYDAVILIAPTRANDRLLRRAVEPLIGAISVEAMRTANLSVDRDDGKVSPAEAARNLEAVVK